MSHIHIPDGVLPLWLWASGWLAALVLLGIVSRLSQRHDMRRKVPLLGVVSALMLVAMSSEIVPLAYHINLTVVGGVLLGPVLSPIAAFIVVVVLAMLGHGGVTVIGLNALIVSCEMVVGWALFHGLLRLFGRRRARVGAGIATVATLALTTTLLVGIVWIGGSAATTRETGALDPADLAFENPFSSGVFSVGLFAGGHEHAEDEDEDAHAEDEHAEEHAHAEDEHAEDAHAEEATLSVGRFAAVVYTLGPLGWVIEALVTAAVFGYVAHVRPSLLFEGALAAHDHPRYGDEHGRH